MNNEVHPDIQLSLSSTDKANKLRALNDLGEVLELIGVTRVTLTRWITEGRRVKGHRVFLPALRLKGKGRLYTSYAAIDAFENCCIEVERKAAAEKFSRSQNNTLKISGSPDPDHPNFKLSAFEAKHKALI